MKRCLLAWATIGLLISIAACSGGEATDVAPTTTPSAATLAATDSPATLSEFDVVYATAGERALTLDMYAPAESGGAPVLIYLPGQYGGGFGPTPNALAEQGVIAFVVQYAEINDGPEKILSEHGAVARAMGESVACALHFARARATQLGSADPAVVVTGFSAGGGLAAHVALFGGTLEVRWDEFGAAGGPPRQIQCEVTDGSTHVDALVGFAGDYDVFVPIYEGKWGRAYQQEHDPGLWTFLSSSIGANPGLKVRLLHGDADGTIPYENSVGFAASLTEAGYDVQLASFAGGHSAPTDLTLQTVMDAIGQ